jgi:hypothetical protein
VSLFLRPHRRVPGQPHTITAHADDAGHLGDRAPVVGQRRPPPRHAGVPDLRGCLPERA